MFSLQIVCAIKEIDAILEIMKKQKIIVDLEAVVRLRDLRQALQRYLIEDDD